MCTVELALKGVTFALASTVKVLDTRLLAFIDQTAIPC